MTKEQLIALGASEELATKIAEESVKELAGYVEKSKYSEVETAKKQIEDMQTANKNKEKEYADSIAKLKLDNAVDIALMGAGSKNNKAVKALLNLEKAVIGEDGKIVGLKEQLDNLRKAEDSSFLFETTPKFKGVNPAGNKNPEADFKTMTYSQMEKYLAENPSAKIDDIL